MSCFKTAREEQEYFESSYNQKDAADSLTLSSIGGRAERQLTETLVRLDRTGRHLLLISGVLLASKAAASEPTRQR